MAAESGESGEIHLRLRRARPGDISAMVSFLNRVRQNRPPMDQAELMQSFADRGFMLAEQDRAVVGVAAWHVENLVACIEEFYVSPVSLREVVGPRMLAALEEAANQLMAEAALVFVTLDTPRPMLDMFARLGYQTADLSLLPRAWREAALSLVRPGTRVLSKQLRERTMRPI